MWYFIVSIIVAFAIFTVLYAYHKTSSRLSYIDDLEELGFFGPILGGLFWPLTLFIGGCYLIFKLYLSKYYDTFIKWLGDKLFPDV
jgi:hypothetical protein